MRVFPGFGPIDVALRVHEEVRSWEYPPLHPRVPFLIGSGPFAGSGAPGTHRLIAVFRSPMTGTLHVSALGGAAWKWHRSGVSGIVVVGRSERPVAIAVGGPGDVRIIEVDLERAFSHWRRGAYGLAKHLVEASGIPNARAVVIGPAATRTLNGVLFSPDIERGELRPGTEDSAARGGPGSALYRAHNVVGFVVGGSEPRPHHLVDTRPLDEAARRVLGRRFPEAVLAATTKYRFDERLGTGGTFGVNYVHYRDLLPIFGYKSIYLSHEERVRHAQWILELFWKPFNRVVFEEGRSWYNCGEPCPVVCKKVWRGKKVDYEPFHGMGPFIGNYIFEEAVKLVDLVDELGMDAIEAGHEVAFLFDAVWSGLLTPEEAGLSDKPVFDPRAFDPLRDSPRNAKLAREALEAIYNASALAPRLIAERGLRAAAKELTRMFSGRVAERGVRFEDLAVYVPLGENHYMTPNYYWSPGMVAPLYMLGRYWTNYNPEYAEPEEYADSALRRAYAEYAVDNAGICRFHRGWAEKLLDEMYRAYYGEEGAFRRAEEGYAKLAWYARRVGSEPMPWEGSRARDVVSSIARELGAPRRFESAEDYLDWWRRFRRRVDEKVFKS